MSHLFENLVLFFAEKRRLGKIDLSMIVKDGING